jgi:hypothetical protein
MLGIRKLALSSARVAARSTRVAARASSTGFDKKERGEEAIFFQHEDARLKHEMRTKMDKLMELDDSHEDKQDLVQLLSKSCLLVLSCRSIILLLLLSLLLFYFYYIFIFQLFLRVFTIIVINIFNIHSRATVFHVVYSYHIFMFQLIYMIYREGREEGGC